MKAKDTVMSDEQLEGEIRKDYKDFRVRDETGYSQDILVWTREAQAEVSFKAGKESLLGEIKAGNISAGSLIHSAKRAGIREVVEWGNQWCDDPVHETALDRGGSCRKRKCSMCYQAKLKEWGLNNG